MKYCIFSGTFNPIHQAHLFMAENVLNKFNFDKIIFIPAYIQPFKEAEYCELSSQHRLKMLQLALKKYPKFTVDIIEFERKGLSYTYLTILELYKKLPDIEGKINFIIGTDAFLNIHKWYQAKDLIKLLNFIVLIRDESELEQCKQFSDIDFEILQSDKINISSTMIRDMVKNKQDITAFVPTAVKNYIIENNLYIG